MAFTFTAVAGLLMVVMVHSQQPPEAHLPEDYIVDVSQECGTQGTSSLLYVRTDLDVSVKVKCFGNNVFNFTTTNNVDFYATVYFDGSETDRCVYPQREGVEIYCVEIIVNIIEGEGDAFINREARYLMSCTYDEQGQHLSEGSDVKEQFYAAKDRQSLVGSTTQLATQVLITDILGVPLPSANIPIDKYVCLKVLLDNSTGLLTNNSIAPYPVSCEAVGATTGHRHAFLRGGCGDGIIFEKDAGFAMRPSFAVSPYFRFFCLETDTSFKVVCNFTLCSNCVGKNSCTGQVDPDRSIFDLFGEWFESENNSPSPP